MSFENYSFTPRRLIIDLIRLQDQRGIPVSDLLAAGKIFDIKESSMRVVITRLLKEGAIESPRRGFYILSEHLSTHNSEILGWGHGEARCSDWQGDWIFVQFGKVGDRTLRRHSFKALTFLGFKEGLDNTWVRPNNLASGYSDTMTRLYQTGLEAEIPSFRVAELDATLKTRFASLWNTKAYEERYLETIESLRTSELRLPDLNTDEALRESFLQGGKAIHVLVTDPLLPPPMMQTELREELTQQMLHYDEVGRRYWNAFTQTEDSLSSEANATLNTIHAGA